MPVQLVLFVVLGVGAIAVAATAALAARDRARLLGRARAAGDEPSRVIIDTAEAPTSAVGEWLRDVVPASWVESDELKTRLVRAGYESPLAPLIYTTARVITAVALPILFVPLMTGMTFGMVVLVSLWSLFAGWTLPIWFLKRQAYRRQERIRHAVPDALDLLVVCIEAGVSLDAAILRVAREIARLHEDLSLELLTVTRKTNAGVPREQALRGLWDRTGVEEVRALVSTMIQSERWGTSIGHVLQVYAETLRRKRRQAVEKKAAVAPLKMLFPLILFILPALFAVVMGPAVLQIAKMFKTVGGGG